PPTRGGVDISFRTRDNSDEGDNGGHASDPDKNLAGEAERGTCYHYFLPGRIIGEDGLPSRHWQGKRVLRNEHHRFGRPVGIVTDGRQAGHEHPADNEPDYQFNEVPEFLGG